jgi:hypothetical protein
VERRETALEEQIKDLRQVSELLHDARATGIMYETQSLAVRALRELLDNPDRDNWDEILAANRAQETPLRQEFGKPAVEGGAGGRPRAIRTQQRPGRSECISQSCRRFSVIPPRWPYLRHRLVKL